MPAFGLVEESTMNEYAAPYTPSMPFFTLPSNSEAPYSSYSATSIQPDVPSMYYYDSGYSPYVPYCPDFTTSSNPQFNQDWFVGSSVPPVSHDWYPENEDPAIPYYPAAPSFDNSGFYAYGSCHYPEQLHGDPLVSSTVITTTPWENCPPVSTAATTATDFYESLQTSSCDFYGGYENKEDKQSQKLQEEDNSTASGGHYLDKTHRAGKSTESSMEVKLVQPFFGFKHSHSPYTGLNVEASKSAESSERFKQVSSFWQENASTTVGMEHSHAMSTCLSSEADKVTECFKGLKFKQSNSPCQESDSTTVGMGSSHTMSTCFDFEGFPTISPQKDFGSNVQGSFSRKLQQSNELLEPLFGWTASYPADIPVPRANISLSRPMSSALSPLINWAASYSDDTPVSRPNFSLSRPIGSVSLSLESSLPTFFGNYDMYKSPMLLSSRSTTERAPTHVQESKGKAEDAIGIKSNMEHCGNRKPVYEGKTTPETSFGCSIKTKKTIHSPATTEQASNVLDFDMKPMPSTSPSHCNDPSNCAIQSPDVPLMNDMLCNQLSSFQEMDFHTKRMEDFLANCSKGGESADDALLIARSDGSGSYQTQKHSAAYRHGHFSPTLDILSSDCHLPKPSWLFPTSLSESASSFSSSQFVDGSTSREVLGSSKLLHSSLIKTAPIISAPQLLNESKGSEETKACQSLPLGIDKTVSVECTKVSFGNATGSLSENTKLRNDLSISSKEVVDPRKECHMLVHTMHNISVVLLASSSSSDNIRESDVQVLQSAICNLSQCLVKRMGLSTSTVGSAMEPEKPMATPNIKRNQKAFKLDRRCSKVDDVVDFPRRELKEFVACSAVGGKELPVERTNSFQISAEAMQSQMVNIEADLDLMKFEIRCLKMELEMERLRKSHEGALKFGDSEISANKNAVNSISPDLNLGIKGNDSNHTAEPISQETGHGLPDLNLNPIRDSAVQTDATIKFEGILISQNKSHGESSLNSRASTSDQKTGQLNAETGNGQIEDPSGSKLNMSCMGGSDEGKMQCTNQSSLPEWTDSSQLNGQHKVPSIIPASLEIGPYCTDSYELKSNNLAHSLQGSILCDNSPRERDSHLEGQNEVSFAKHTQIEILNSKDSNFFMDDRFQTGNIFLEGGATAESPTESKSIICFRDLENVNGMHISKEVPCSELDLGWEHINSNEEDHIYSSDEDSMFIF